MIYSPCVALATTDIQYQKNTKLGEKIVFEFTRRKNLDVSMIIKEDGVFLLLNFKRHRTKFLKKQRTFCAKVYCGEISLEKMFTGINEWFDKLADDQLLERLEDSPNNNKPIISIAPRIKFDFNVPEEEITTLLWPLSFS